MILLPFDAEGAKEDSGNVTAFVEPKNVVWAMANDFGTPLLNIALQGDRKSSKCEISLTLCDVNKLNPMHEVSLRYLFFVNWIQNTEYSTIYIFSAEW